jgi:hypothetical protein
MTLPRVITADELVKGQHIQVRHNYDEHRALVFEGLVDYVSSGRVTLVDVGLHQPWVVNQPNIDVIITLLADPEPQYEFGELADVTYGPGIGITQRTERCFWSQPGIWWTTEDVKRISPALIKSVIPLRVARPEDVIIPVKDGKAILGSDAKGVHEIADMLRSGLGGREYEAMADLFCPVDGYRECCVKHRVHADNCKCIEQVK